MAVPGLEAALKSRRKFVEETSVSVTGSGGSAPPSARSGRAAKFAGMRFVDKSPTGRTGLANQGATCYLNSLLQLLFMLPDCRAAVFGAYD